MLVEMSEMGAQTHVRERMAGTRAYNKEPSARKYVNRWSRKPMAL